MRIGAPPLRPGAPAGDDLDAGLPVDRRGSGRFAATGIALALLLAAAILVARPRGEPTTTPDLPSEPTSAPPPPLSSLAAAPRGRSPQASAPARGPAAGPEANAAATALAGIAADLEAHRWAPAREKLAAFALAHQDADDATRTSLDALRERFTRDRTAAFAEVAGRRLPEILRTRVAARVADPEATHADASAWARKMAVDETFQGLLDELLVADSAVSADEAKVFWDSRPRTDASWKPMDRAMLRWVSGPLDRGAIEAWWRGASRDDRTELMVIVLVTKSGLFEVDGDRYR